MAPEIPSAEEQAALAEQMKAPRPAGDPAVASDYEARYKELQADLTVERAARDKAERERDAAEARALALQPQNVGAAGRQVPILYTIKDSHVSPNDDSDPVSNLVADINKEHGLSLTKGDFLAMNAETLDNEAKARGFTTGARYALRTESGETVSGHHLFAGTQVVVGQRK